MIAFLMLTRCIFRLQMGRGLLKLTAMLSHAQRIDNLAMLYCCLELERFLAIRRRRCLDDSLKAAECVCMYLNSSPVSVAQSECCSTPIETRVSLGAMCASVRLGSAVMFLHDMELQSLVTDQCSDPSVGGPSPSQWALSLCHASLAMFYVPSADWGQGVVR